MIFPDEDIFEAHRAAAHQENFEVYQLVKAYRKVLRGLKCPEHKTAARIDHCHRYEPYDDGNYTRIYFTQCCCPILIAEAEKRLEKAFLHYKDHRVFEDCEE